jgi:hypothetical protein
LLRLILLGPSAGLPAESVCERSCLAARVGPLQGACERRVRAANENSNPQRPRHTLGLVWVAGRAVCLSPPDTTQGTVTKEGQGRATWHAERRLLVNGHGWPTGEAVEALGGVRS